MMRRQLARAVFYASTVLLIGMVLLAFVFPRFVAAWAQQGEPLSRGTALLVSLARFCQMTGLLAMPLLLAGIVGPVLWRVASERQHKDQPTSFSS